VSTQHTARPVAGAAECLLHAGWLSYQYPTGASHVTRDEYGCPTSAYSLGTSG
jgi:hypothetical protein